MPRWKFDPEYGPPYRPYYYEPEPRPRRRTRSSSSSFRDFIEADQLWDQYAEYKKKEFERHKKEEHKPPTPGKQMLNFIQWWSVMAVCGLPIGIVTLVVMQKLIQGIPALITPLVR